MRSSRVLALVVAIPMVAGACGVDAGVTAERADPIAPLADAPPADAGQLDTLPEQPVPDQPATASTAPPETPAPAPTGSPLPPGGSAQVPDSGAPDTGPATTVGPVDPDAIDFGAGKPEQPYDQFLLAAVTDIERWWSEQYPVVYGGTFEPLEGRIIAAYPDRPDDIPGCGEARTSYEEVREFAAFYCAVGDFMVYDDADDGLLATLAHRFGPATIAIVLAHEYGHAVQLRVGALESGLPTITTEQQADCFAGAWSARVAAGSAGGITFSDDDIRAGLISMLEVRDPVGLNQFAPGGHGTGFDRVNAFQEGFLEGLGRCTELLDDPMALSPADFFGDDGDAAGNAPWGFEGEAELFRMLSSDLNLYWGSDVESTAGRFETLTVVAVDSPEQADCDQLSAYFAHGAALCVEDDVYDDVVYVYEPAAYGLYVQDLFGDFSVGYLLGTAWAEAAQRTLGIATTGEQRALVDDCLTGAWVQTDILVEDPDTGLVTLPEPRDPERQTRISPGDLDETVRTMLLVGDATADADVVGTPFEKIEAFRSGMLGGVDACLAGF